MSWRATRQPFYRYPRCCTFLVTWRCNGRCVMCGIWKGRHSGEMALDEIRRVFRKLTMVRALRISGGEPFLRDDLADIINEANRIIRPRFIHLTSNGLLTPRILDAIENIDKTDNLHIKISIDDVGKGHDGLRGVTGAYEKALSTLEALAALRPSRRFYLGVAQTLVRSEQLSEGLPAVCRSLGVGLHQVLAYDFCPLYGAETSNIAGAYARYGSDDARRFIEFMRRNVSISNFGERLAKKYYLRGLENRLLRGENQPNPRCAALSLHLRLLPDGAVPVCLYFPEVTGSLLDESLEALWFGSRIAEHRHKVRGCPGCWAGCEVIPSAVFSGDILRALFY